MSSSTGPIAACTIVARNYLSHARVLAKSFREHHPGSRFYLLVVDGLPEGVEPDTGVDLFVAADLPCPHIRELCFKYDVTELCTALKPTFLKMLLARRRDSAVVYVDPDVLFLGPLSGVGDALGNSSFLLTPHLLHPLPLDGRRPTEMDILSTGVYNLGFIAVRECRESSAFLDWWEERLREGCLLDPSGRHFVDQKWVDWAPCFFPSAGILRDETCNVAVWNLVSRPIERRGSRFFVRDRPLTFFHFSGFEVEGRYFRSQPSGRVTREPGSPLAELCEIYGKLQEENGYATSIRWKYGYSSFSDGVPIGTAMRRLFLSIPPVDRERFGDPFSVEGAESFRRWALTPNFHEGGLTPFLTAIYRLRPDVMAAFPDVSGADREGFVGWARTTGLREMSYEPSWVGASPETTRDAVSRIVSVSLSTEIAEELWGRWIDLPKAGQAMQTPEVEVTGWVLGRRAAAEAVEFAQDGRVFSRAPIQVGRPDVSGSYLHVAHAARSGFRALVPVPGGPGESEWSVDAVLPEGKRVRIAVIRSRRDGERKLPPPAPETQIEISEVVLEPLASERFLGFSLDTPKALDRSDARSLEIAGWIVSRDRSPVSIEITGSDGGPRDLRANLPRPDVAAAFSDSLSAGQSGFSTKVSVADPVDSSLHVLAVFHDGSRHALATIRFRRPTEGRGPV